MNKIFFFVRKISILFSFTMKNCQSYPVPVHADDGVQFTASSRDAGCCLPRDTRVRVTMYRSRTVDCEHF